MKKIIIKTIQTDEEKKQERLRLKKYIISSIASFTIGALIALAIYYFIRTLMDL